MARLSDRLPENAPGLVDSPRHASQLVRRLEAMGGASMLFLSHQDDVADHRKAPPAARLPPGPAPGRRGTPPGGVACTRGSGRCAATSNG